MKPIIILPPNQMSQADVEELRKNDLCVVVADDPAKVKLVDPIPAQISRTQIEDAAIRLSQHFSKMFVEMLITGTPLDARGTEHEHYNWRLKAEREARKKGKEQKP